MAGCCEVTINGVAQGGAQGIVGGSGTGYGSVAAAQAAESSEETAFAPQAGTANGVVVGTAGLSAVDDFYKDYWVVDTDPTPGNGLVNRYARVSSYDGTTKTLTLDAPWNFAAESEVTLVKPVYIGLNRNVTEDVAFTKPVVLNLGGFRLQGTVDVTGGLLTMIRDGIVTDGVQKTNQGVLWLEALYVSRRDTGIYAVLLTNGSDLGRCVLMNSTFGGRVASRRGRMGWLIDGCQNDGVPETSRNVPYALVESVAGVAVVVTQLDAWVQGEWSGAVFYSENSLTATAADVRIQMNVALPIRGTGAPTNIGSLELFVGYAVGAATLDVTATVGDLIRIRVEGWTGGEDGAFAVLGSEDLSGTARLILNGSSRFGVSFEASYCHSVMAVSLKGSTHSGTVTLGGTASKHWHLSNTSFNVVFSRPDVTAGTLTISGAYLRIDGGGFDELTGFGYFTFFPGTITGAATWTISVAVVVGMNMTRIAGIFAPAPSAGSITVSGAFMVHHSRTITLVEFNGAGAGPTYTFSGNITAYWSSIGSTDLGAASVFLGPVGGSTTISGTVRILGYMNTNITLVASNASGSITLSGAVELTEWTSTGTMLLANADTAGGFSGLTGTVRIIRCRFQGAFVGINAILGSTAEGPSTLLMQHCFFGSTWTDQTGTGTLTWAAATLKANHCHFDGLVTWNGAQFGTIEVWESVFNGSVSQKSIDNGAATTRPATLYRLWKCTFKAKYDALLPEVVTDYENWGTTAAVLARGQPVTVDATPQVKACVATSIVAGIILDATGGAAGDPAVIVKDGLVFASVDAAVVAGDNLALDVATPTQMNVAAFTPGQNGGFALEAAGNTIAGKAYTMLRMR